MGNLVTSFEDEMAAQAAKNRGWDPASGWQPQPVQSPYAQPATDTTASATQSQWQPPAIPGITAALQAASAPPPPPVPAISAALGAAVGPGGRTYDQITGTDYLNEAEMNWYRNGGRYPAPAPQIPGISAVLQAPARDDLSNANDIAAWEGAPWVGTPTDRTNAADDMGRQVATNQAVAGYQAGYSPWVREQLQAQGYDFSPEGQISGFQGNWGALPPGLGEADVQAGIDRLTQEYMKNQGGALDARLGGWAAEQGNAIYSDITQPRQAAQQAGAYANAIEQHEARLPDPGYAAPMRPGWGTPSTLMDTLREGRGVENPTLGFMTPVLPAPGGTHGIEMPFGISDFMRNEVQPRVGDVTGQFARATGIGGILDILNAGGGNVPSSYDVGRAVGTGLTPVTAEEFGLELLPGIGSVGDIARLGAGGVRGASRLASEGATAYARNAAGLGDAVVPVGGAQRTIAPPARIADEPGQSASQLPVLPRAVSPTGVEGEGLLPTGGAGLKDVNEELRAAIQSQNAAGARIQVRNATTHIDDRGPLSITGTDAKGRSIKLQGTEEVLARELRSDFYAPTPRDIPQPPAGAAPATSAADVPSPAPAVSNPLRDADAALPQTQAAAGAGDNLSAIAKQTGINVSTLRAGDPVALIDNEIAIQTNIRTGAQDTIARIKEAQKAPGYAPTSVRDGAAALQDANKAARASAMRLNALNRARETLSPGAAPAVKPPTAVLDAPPPATPPPPPTGTGGAGDEFAANIRLSKYPEEVRGEIKGWADANPQAVDAARRGIQGDEVTREAARQLVEDMGGSFNKIQKQWKPGEAWNAEEIVAIRGVLNQRTEEVLDAAKAARGGDVTAQTRLLLAIEEQARVQQVVHGVTAEAGRALRAFRQSADQALANSDVDRLREILARTAKGNQIEDIAAALEKIDINNPAAVNNFLRGLQKPELWDYVRELWINSVLSGPPTHMVNILSNAANTMLSPVERGLAAAADTIVAPIQGRARERFFSEVKADAFGAMQALPEATKAMLIALRDGISPASATKLEVRKQAFRGPLGAAIRAPGTALEAMDSFFYTLNYRAALNANIMRQARSEKLTGQALIERIAELQADPSYQLIKGARATAEYRVFREPSDVANAIIHLREKAPVLQFFIPFVRTPTNLVKFGIERSPLGFYDAFRQVAKGNPEAADKMARAAMGSVIAGGIALQFEAGNITGAAPKNSAERDRFYREGKQPYSMKIGGKWVSYQKIEPFNQPIAQVAAFMEAAKDKNASPTQLAGRAAMTIADNLVSQSYLTGISTLINAFTDPERYAGNVLTRIATGFQPYSSASRFATRLTDDTIRKPEGLEEAFKAQIPGMSKDVPPRLDAFGNVVKRQSPPWSPIPVTPANQSQVDAELERVGVEVGFVGDSIANIAMSREQQAAYQKAAGRVTYQVYEQLLGDSSYQALPDAMKALALERAKDKVRDIVRKEMVQQLVPAGSR